MCCVEPRPWSRQAPGGLPSGVWYTPEAAPLPARAGKEARGPLDSGSLPSRRSKPLSQLSAEIPVSWHSARSGTEEIGLFRAGTQLQLTTADNEPDFSFSCIHTQVRHNKLRWKELPGGEDATDWAGCMPY